MFNFFQKTDSQIQKDVTNELNWDSSVHNDSITVTANDGIVTLRGSVPHYFDKTTAENAAQRVGGVRAVADEIQVDISGTYVKSDEEIAVAAVSALKWDYSVPEGVKVTVDNAWITLTGELTWDYQRSAAKDAVKLLLGVKGVHNKITIKPEVQPTDVKSRIEAALKRSAETESRKITVTVDGSAVTLSGNLATYSEITDARIAAWNAPGVLTVIDNLKLAQ